MNQARWYCHWAALWLWVVAIFGTTTYLVFWKDANGAWYILAFLLTQVGPDCK